MVINSVLDPRCRHTMNNTVLVSDTIISYFTDAINKKTNKFNRVLGCGIWTWIVLIEGQRATAAATEH